jgi:hypothetical protein
MAFISSLDGSGGKGRKAQRKAVLREIIKIVFIINSIIVVTFNWPECPPTILPI